MIEYEKKVLMSLNEYFWLLQKLPIKETYSQINFYYDTDSFAMNRAGVTCRIRSLNGKYKATVKEHNVRMRDRNIERSRYVVSGFDNSFFEGMGIRYQGMLVTHRTIISNYDGLKIMLDKNCYLYCEDYELEIEYSPDTEFLANKFLQSIGEILNAVDASFNSEDFRLRALNSKSKANRFFERLSFIQKERI